MAVEFRNVHCPPLDGFSASAPDGCVIGIIGERGSGKGALLKLAAGLQSCEVGEVIAPGTRRYIGPQDRLVLSPADVIAIEHAFALHDAIIRARGMVALERLRRGGSTILLVSHEQPLLSALCDEVWWVQEGRLAAGGHPREVLDAYNRSIAEKFREWGETLSEGMATTIRRGDGRAEVLSIVTLGSAGTPTVVWRSGEEVGIRVTVRYRAAVLDPVVGIMIRTRIGFEVYGTNTEAEHVRIGPCEAGDTVAITFSFIGQLCPQEYTITAASHDPDGTAHDWLDDAVAVSVTDDRFTAGVANLRARIGVERGVEA
ncbi:MAG: Wzt carbohydrate-binding domain-containing protein [Bryobacteraceae bacterium]|jgi:lipopolysaccharide transport system ATP-binding protein